MQIVQADPAEYDPYNLCTRRIGNAVAVEVRIRGAGAAAMTVERSHRLTIDIGCRLRERFGEGTFVAVHVEPLMQRAAPFARRPPLTGFRSSFSLRRSSQVCFRRRNLCRRPLFGADVRCARPVRRNGLAPHPFPRADARMGGPNPDAPPCILPRPLPPGAPVSGDCGTRRSVSCMYPLSRSSEDRDRKGVESAAAGEF